MYNLFENSVNTKGKSFIKIEGIKTNFLVNEFVYEEEISGLIKLSSIFFDNLNEIKSDIIEKKIELNFEVIDNIYTYKKELRSRIIYGYISNYHCYRYEFEGNECKQYNLIIKPFIGKLSVGKKRKIYQNKSSIEVAKELFKERNFSDYKFVIINESLYKKNEYLTQYDESDLDFVLRILEQDGISFHILNDEKTKKQEVIIFDNKSEFKDLIQGQFWPVFSFTAKNNFKEIYIPIEKHADDNESLLIHSYNHKIPKTDLTQKKKEKQNEFSCYYDIKYSDIGEGEKSLKFISNELKLQKSLIQFFLRRPIKICDKFKIKSDKFKQFEKEYVVYKSKTKFENEKIFIEIQSFPSDCEFSLPKKYNKPMVHGAQLAVVVGNENDNVFVNKMATVRVQFYWDLFGKKNADSSNDIRVAQLFGGKSGSKSSMGSWFIPRVGQEVLVHFINADPDQPVIMGCLYNGVNSSPYDGKETSEGFTKTGIKTCSIPDGDKGHELTFEDKKDAEKILMSSTRDLEVIVANDSKLNIAKNYNVNIEEGNYSFEIKKGDRKIILKEGNYSINIEKGQLTIETSEDVSIKAKGNINIEAAKSLKMKANSIEVKSDTNINLDAGTSFSIKGQDISTSSMTSTTIKASTGLQLSGGTSANMKAPSVAVQGDMKFEITAPLGKVQATGPLEISGAITKVN